MSAPDAIVVGGGIVGCACAYALARDGLHVRVIEQHRVGAHASGGSAGVLSAGQGPPNDTPFDRLCSASRALHSSYAPQLHEETGIDVELQESGSLTLLRDCPARPIASSADTQQLDAQQLRTLEPQVAESWAAALFFPRDGQVNTGRLTRALAEAAARRGAEFSEGVVVTGFLPGAPSDRACGVRTTAGDIPAGAVVLAAGPWSGLLGPSLGRQIPVFPVKGQMVWAQPRPPAGRSQAVVLRRPVFALNCYLVPKVELGIAIGASHEHAGFDETPTLDVTAQLIETAISVCPALQTAELRRVWASVRPGSADGLPILGPVSDRPGVILATGHYANGVLLSLITGELVANWLLERPQPVDVSPFSLERFT